MQIQQRNRFQLDDQFVLDFARQAPDWGPLGYITYKRTYARPLSSVPDRIRDLGTRALLGSEATEEWWLTCARVIEGMFSVQKQHCYNLGLPWDKHRAAVSAIEAYRLMFDFKWLPPGRGLWMMGTEFVEKKGGAALNNCAFISTADIDTDFAEPFCFLMDMSMYGVGVGFDTMGAGKARIVEPLPDPSTFIVPDAREGWVFLIRRVLAAFVGKGLLPEVVDYSQVRPEGSPIKGFGGVASGPEPLKKLHERLIRRLKGECGRRVDQRLIVDIMTMIGDCVVAGNVRRSAEIALGNGEDFWSLKTGGWCYDYPWRARANFSIVKDEYDDGYSEVSDCFHRGGELGVFWLGNARAYSRMGDPPDGRDHRVGGCNPCAEQSLEPYELCCLVETFPSRCEDQADYYRVLKFAYMYAKTVTLIPTHNKRTNAVMMRNRRIGCSQSGIVQAIASMGWSDYKGLCDEGYGVIQHYDRVYSNWFCTPRSIKTTSIKPSGSVSLLPGVSAGVHQPISEHYFKVMRISPTSMYLPALRAAGYRVVDLPKESSVGVYFPVHMPGARGRASESMWEQLERAAQLQAIWADNQVSCTVTFKPHELDEIPRALAMYANRLKGITFLPLDTSDYEHPPEQAISKEEYDQYVASLRPLDLSGGKHEVESKFCDGETCEI